MFFNRPNCSGGARGWSGCGPRPAAAAPQVQAINIGELLEGIATAAAVAESVGGPWMEEIKKAAGPWMEQMQKSSAAGPSSSCRGKGKSPSVSTTDDKFEVKVDITNFTPEEINVSVKDNSIIIEAKHEEKEDKFGFISRQFTRRFVLPEGVVLDQMNCKVVADNVIVISAPRIVEKEKPVSNEKFIPISIVNSSTNSSNPSSEAGDAAEKLDWEKI
jgi:HSP20 family molecular chaperone IbpA